MIVFYDKATETCMLSINCSESDISVIDGKAYFKCEIVNNNMAISAYTEVPEQSIYTELIDEGGFLTRTPKLFSELTRGSIAPSDADRISALESAVLVLMGV
jgi:hypothetical protein